MIHLFYKYKFFCSKYTIQHLFAHLCTASSQSLWSCPCVLSFLCIYQLSGHVRTWCINFKPILHHIALASLFQTQPDSSTWIQLDSHPVEVHQTKRVTLAFSALFLLRFNRTFNHIQNLYDPIKFSWAMAYYFWSKGKKVYFTWHCSAIIKELWLCSKNKKHRICGSFIGSKRLLTGR